MQADQIIRKLRKYLGDEMNEILREDYLNITRSYLCFVLEVRPFV